MVLRAPGRDRFDRAGPTRPGEAGPAAARGRNPTEGTSKSGNGQEYSESGQPIYRHDRERWTGHFEPTEGDEVAIRTISDHIEAHVGPIETVYHVIVSNLVHIDLHLVKITHDRPCRTFVTSGMSDRPMRVPEDIDAPRHFELSIDLAAEWPVAIEDRQDGTNYWPLRMLKNLARLPHLYETWLGIGHTVPNGDPPEPYVEGTQLCCALIVPPLSVPDDFGILGVPEIDRTIHLLSVFPITRREMELNLRYGSDAFFDLFETRDVGPTIDPH